MRSTYAAETDTKVFCRNLRSNDSNLKILANTTRRGVIPRIIEYQVGSFIKLISRRFLSNETIQANAEMIVPVTALLSMSLCSATLKSSVISLSPSGHQVFMEASPLSKVLSGVWVAS